MKLRVYKSGKILIKENEYPSSAYLICHGNVNIYNFRQKTVKNEEDEMKKERDGHVKQLLEEYVKRELQIKLKLMTMGVQNAKLDQSLNQEMKNRDKLLYVLQSGQIVGTFADTNAKIGK
jgi:hypothetical protein